MRNPVKLLAVSRKSLVSLKKGFISHPLKSEIVFLAWRDFLPV